MAAIYKQTARPRVYAWQYDDDSEAHPAPRPTCYMGHEMNETDWKGRPQCYYGHKDASQDGALVAHKKLETFS